MKYWQNYKRRIKLFLLKGREKKELPCSEIGENIIPLSEIENGFGENFDQTRTKNKKIKKFFP